MKSNKRFIAFVVATVVGVAGISLPIDTVKAEETSREYVVMAKNEAGYEEVQEMPGVEITEEATESTVLEENHIAVVELTETEAEKLEDDKNILFVEEDILFEGSGVKSVSGNKKNKKNNSDKVDEVDKKLELKKLREESKVSVEAKEQWNIDAIHANSQEYNKAENQVKVAVMDTGVTMSSDIDVAGRVNLIEGEEDVHPFYEDVSGHGTAVASVIAAKENDIGITGVNPNVELYSVKVLDDNKTASLSRIVEGIYWCIENDMNIINMSFGTSVKSEILEQVIKEADKSGILMIAAAGNLGQEAGESTVEYPAAYEEVLAVGATTPDGTVSKMSSVGEEVELVAPGEAVPATGHYGTVVKTEGTSMAAPHVTGTASVLWAKDTSKSSDFIRELLSASAIAIDDIDNAGNGIVDLAYALSVYEEFEANYEEGVRESEELVKENPAEVTMYEEEQVEASWRNRDHYATVIESGTALGINATDLQIIGLGAKAPDLCIKKEGDDGAINFHGFGNYVANYIYVMRLAQSCYTNGLNTAFKNVKHPLGNAKRDELKVYLKKFFDKNEASNYTSLITNSAGQYVYSDNKKTKALLLAGIATHMATDVYAHRAYYYDTTTKKWILIPKIMQILDGKEVCIRDITTVVPNRWETAESVAGDILTIWACNSFPDALEFYQPGIHAKDDFKLYKFKTWVSAADFDTYDVLKSWFKNRSADD